MQSKATQDNRQTAFINKSTVDEIRARFDHEVDRFSELETGQQAMIDAALVLELVAQTSATHLQPGASVLDVGCGAGNFTLRVLQKIKPLHCHLVDLSQPMLERARERIETAGNPSVTAHQADFRELDFASASFDCILAGASLHHLREERDWTSMFDRLHQWLRPGGRLYVADLLIFDVPEVQQLMWERFGNHLESLEGPAYRDKVFAYIDKEDTPRSLPFQIDLLRQCGFLRYDVLHRNSVSTCYFAEK